MSPHLAAVLAWFTELAPASLAHIDRIYAHDAHFHDPFNDVRGAEGIADVFRHMFAHSASPRFTILNHIEQGSQAFVSWDFDVVIRGRPFRIHGGSHLLFDPSGRITLHRDYWDTGEELYAGLPVIGVAIRWLRRRLGVPPRR